MNGLLQHKPVIVAAVLEVLVIVLALMSNANPTTASDVGSLVVPILLAIVVAILTVFIGIRNGKGAIKYVLCTALQLFCMLMLTVTHAQAFLFADLIFFAIPMATVFL